MAIFPAWVLIVAAAIVFGLAVVAGFYWRKLQLAQRRQAAQLEALEKGVAAQRRNLIESIQILARTLLNDGVGLIEASIRIRVLMDALQLEQSVRDEFAVFFTVADKAGHIPILQEWQKLSRKKQFQYEQEMAALEAEYRDFALDAARRLSTRNFDRPETG
ncbi:DUF2489 domain-containing protein [Microbulbifer sp. 2201CG32-9]|uniref:DUF2489 domain-containing protein n=1 Tax=unclassified Microbulbifer TaxID=2619833 RepID=UPI00345BD815